MARKSGPAPTTSNCMTRRSAGAILYGLPCDIDVNSYAPFNHDAQTYGNAAAVREPSSLVALLSGLASAAAVRTRPDHV
jgi:hypothetical protein